MVNLILKEFLSGFSDEQKKSEVLKAAILGLGVLFCIIGYGSHRLSEPIESDEVTISIIQANIPQELKWHEPYWPDIMDKYKILTQQAILSNPDLLIWPETAFPGYVGVHDEFFDQLRSFVSKHRTPLLLGSVVKVREEYFNSAILLSEKGEVSGQYNKLHLVPFGEYIPFRSFFPFLSQIVPIADFTSGRVFTQFSIPNHEDKKFAVLICFEDTVSYLARHFVKKGANLLINVTNDAWFKDTKAPFMHLQAAVFRTIENRRALVRVTNTGVSCFIDQYGRIGQCVQNKNGKLTYVFGHRKSKVQLSKQMTFYTKFGDVFTFLCIGCLFIGLIDNHLRA